MALDISSNLSSSPPSRCVACGSNRVVKHGIDRWVGTGKAEQKYRCNSCGIDFTDSSFSRPYGHHYDYRLIMEAISLLRSYSYGATAKMLNQNHGLNLSVDTVWNWDQKFG